MDNRFGPLPNLSLNQKLQLAISGSAFYKYMKPETFRSSVPVYIVNCNKHGYFLDYRHGYSERFLCRQCLEESKRSNKICQAV